MLRLDRSIFLIRHTFYLEIFVFGFVVVVVVVVVVDQEYFGH